MWTVDATEESACFRRRRLITRTGSGNAGFSFSCSANEPQRSDRCRHGRTGRQVCSGHKLVDSTVEHYLEYHGRCTALHCTARCFRQARKRHLTVDIPRTCRDSHCKGAALCRYQEHKDDIGGRGRGHQR